MNQATRIGANVRFHDAHPSRGDYRSEILAGLRASPKRIDPKWFYDERGSELFARITELPEYYPTRTEMGLLRANSADIAAICGSGCVFLEPGSGNSEKARLLLDALRPAAYVPLDISADFLRAAATRLGEEYPWLPVTAICADFASFEAVQTMLPAGRRVVFYPGSTIGNLEPRRAREFLASLRELVLSEAGGQADGGVLIGVDLHKSTARLEAAYNDAAGITAQFNRNLLSHVNRLIDADFDPEAFEHRAFYDPQRQRIEMHLVSAREQRVRCAGETIPFAAGESLHTENSYKYSVESFGALAADAGFAIRRSWIDDEGLFSLHFLAPAP